MIAKLFSTAMVLFALGCQPAVPETPVAPHESAKSFPKCILIIRHAEKLPPEALDVHLSEAGKKRAEALHGLFEKSDSRPEPFPKPDVLFAAKNSMKSHRPNETIAPLAKELNLKIHDHYNDDEVEGFVKHVFATPKYAGKVLLVSWRHTMTPSLAKHLGVAEPPKWHDDAFDRVWMIEYDEKGKATLKDLPQKLMPGDHKK